MLQLIFITPRRALLTLLLVTSIVWLPSIRGTFFNLDTDWLLISNPILHQNTLPLSTICFDLSKGTRLTLGAEFLPIRDIFVWLEIFLFQNSIVGYHFCSFVLYLGIVSILFWVLYDVFEKNIFKSFWCTLLFSIHNTHVESVAWLANQKDLLSLFFLLCGISFFQKYQRDQRSDQFFLIFLFGVLAYWSKNTAIAFPAILVCWSVLQTRNIHVRLWLSCLLVFLPLLLLSLQVGKNVGMFAHRRGENLWEMICITADVWGTYLGTLFWPQNLSIFYTELPPTVSFSTICGICFFLSTLLLPLYSYIKQQSNLYQISIACFLILFALLPVSQITPIQNLQADRYLLLPSLGYSIIVVELYHLFSFKRVILPIVYATALIIQTTTYLQIWQTEKGIWKNCTEKQPQEVRCWVSRSTTQDTPIDSLLILEEAKKIVGSHPHILQGQGGIFLKINDIEQATVFLEQAWQEDDSLRVAGNNLMQAYRKNNDLERAIEIGEQLTSTHPNYPMGWNTLGTIYMDVQAYQKAQLCFQKALDLQPYSLLPLLNLGNIAFVQEEYDIAIQYWQSTLHIDPTIEHALKGIEAAKARLIVEK